MPRHCSVFLPKTPGARPKGQGTSETLSLEKCFSKQTAGPSSLVPSAAKSDTKNSQLDRRQEDGGSLPPLQHRIGVSRDLTCCFSKSMTGVKHPSFSSYSCSFPLRARLFILYSREISRYEKPRREEHKKVIGQLFEFLVSLLILAKETEESTLLACENKKSIRESLLEQNDRRANLKKLPC